MIWLRRLSSLIFYVDLLCTIYSIENETGFEKNMDINLKNKIDKSRESELVSGERKNEKAMENYDLSIGSCPLMTLNNRTIHQSAKQYSRSSNVLRERESTEIYDYVIVGGGATGCPLARTLAEGGYRVLLLERGPLRSYEETPLATDIYGAGLVIDDPSISQLIETTQGVRTHVASVMGGGTAINLAIIIDEQRAFFEHLSNITKIKFDMDMIQDSYRWISSRLSFAMPRIMPYGYEWKEGLKEQGFKDMDNQGNGKIGYGGDYSNVLKIDHQWGGMSLFDSRNGFFRNASDVLLGRPGFDDPLPNLIVKTRKFVENVEFIRDDKDDRPRAHCVVYRVALSEDISTIGNKRLNFLSKLLKGPNESLNRLGSRLWDLGIVPNQKPILHRACIPPDGEIILSAGAIPTTIILYKSGIGPKEQISEIKVPLVKDMPMVGQEFLDRCLIPIGAFFEADPISTNSTQDGLYQPRICQSIGLKYFGVDCSNPKVYERNLKCSLVPSEELSGGRLSEGVIYATRFIFPPSWRNRPIISLLFKFLEDCGDNRNPLDQLVLAPFCNLTKPIVRCFRRVAANFYFTSEPKSRGRVSMDRHGNITVEANYMSDTQDLFDAIRGVSNLIRIMNSNVYKGTFQPIGQNSCPLQILNGFLDLILQIDASSLFFNSQEREQFKSLHDHVNDLIPPNTKRHRRLALTDGTVVELTPEKMSNADFIHMLAQKSIKLNQTAVAVRDKIMEVMYPNMNSNQTKHISEADRLLAAYQSYLSASTDASNSSLLESLNLLFKKEEINQIQHSKSNENVSYDCDCSNDSHSCGYNDPFLFPLCNHRHLNDQIHGQDIPSQPNQQSILEEMNELSDEFNEYLDQIESTFSRSLMNQKKDHHIPRSIMVEHAMKEAEQIFSKNYKKNKITINTSDKQWAATYPPVLPDPDNPFEVAKYVLQFMTSIWHHAGTVPLGTAVDEKFQLRNVHALGIADASILPIMTRMNPTATLLMLGRYIGLQKLQRRLPKLSV